MLEAGGVNLEGEVAVADGPVFGQFLTELPLASTGFTAAVETIPAVPGLAAGFGPDDLRIGPHEVKTAPLFLFHAVATIEQAVILPAVGDDESRAFDDHGLGFADESGR